MPSAVPAFKDLGKVATGTLYGGSTLNGNKGYDQAIAVSTTAVDGVSFTATVVKKASSVDPSIKASYKHGPYSVAATIFDTGKIATTASWSKVAPGLNLTLTGTMPQIETAKLQADYSIKNLNLKTTLGNFTGGEKQPSLEVSATSSYKDLTLGVDGAFSFERQAVTKWTVAAGYVARDFALSGSYTDNNTLGLTYAHCVSPAFTVAGEVVKNLESEETSVAVGVAKALRGGASTKARIDNKGIASLLYETDLQPGTKLAITGQYNVLSSEAAPKVGLALDVKGP